MPIEIGLGTNLIGPPATIKQRLRLYRDTGVTTLRATIEGSDLDARLDALGLLLDLDSEINQET